MTIRLLHIIPTLDGHGAEKQLALLAAGLPRDRFETHVCCLTRGGPREADLQAARIPVHHIHKRGKFDPRAWWRLFRLIKKLQPQIVHTWLFAANSYGRIAARRAGVPHIIAGERCVDPWKSWHHLAIDRRLARFTKRIACNSAGVRDFYVGKGLPAEKFAVIPNGVEQAAPLFAAEEAKRADRAALLRELGLPADALLIAGVNRLWPQKRVRDLIWSIELLGVVTPNAHLLIVGDGPERNKLEVYCDKLYARERTHFLGERRDVPRLLAHSECLWLASGYEGQSNAILEAMSQGLPVIASDIPGNRDLVVHEQTGCLFRLGDRADIVRQTYRLLCEPERARSYGAAGRERVRAEFSVQQMVDRYVELYQQVVSE